MHGGEFEITAYLHSTWSSQVGDGAGSGGGGLIEGDARMMTMMMIRI